MKDGVNLQEVAWLARTVGRCDLSPFSDAGPGGTSRTEGLPGIDKDAPTGGSITVEVTIPSSGRWGFTCKYHESSGMVGAFVVEG